MTQNISSLQLLYKIVLFWITSLTYSEEKLHIFFFKMIAVYFIAPCSVVGVDWRFRGTHCLHHQGDETETSVYFSETIRRCNPEGYLHTRRRENLKSQIYSSILTVALLKLWEPEISNIFFDSNCGVVETVWQITWRALCYLYLRNTQYMKWVQLPGGGAMLSGGAKT
jgi:hypothetical protein